MVSQPFYPAVESKEGLEEIRGQMISAMKRYNLKELAGPQVGVNLQFVVVQLRFGTFLELINPKITRMYGLEEEEIEGCISVPPHDNRCPVRRMKTIHIRASHLSDINRYSDLVFEGPDARVIQHALDHLEGTFFLHRASIRDRHIVTRRFEEWRDKRRQQRAQEKEKECQLQR